MCTLVTCCFYSVCKKVYVSSTLSFMLVLILLGKSWHTSRNILCMYKITIQNAEGWVGIVITINSTPEKYIQDNFLSKMPGYSVVKIEKMQEYVNYFKR